MRGLLSIALLAGLAAPALAQVETISTGPDRAGVVVYRDQPVDTTDLLRRSNEPWERLDQEGLALIVETRTVDLPAGEGVIRLRGVATGIVPQTATLTGLPAQVVERNADFDLLSPGSLLQRSIGEVVRVVRTNPVNGEQVVRPAVIRSGAAGPVLEVDGKLEALGCSGLTERIIFDRAPEGLGDQPVLSVRTRAPAAGRYTVTLAYLATGLQWSSDYVARLNPDGRTLDLSGWITLANFGGTGFPDAPVQVVAGNLNRDDDTVPVDPVVVQRENRCWPSDTTTGAPPEIVVVGNRVLRREAMMGALSAVESSSDVQEIIVTGSRIVRMDDLGDYKIYTLPEPTTVAARQTKQVQFIQRSGVRYDRLYRFSVEASDDQEGARPDLLLRLRNETASGLGLPLPGGGVSLMERPGGGQALFAGQARFSDVPVGIPVDWRFGEAMDLSIDVESTDDGDGRDRQRYTVEIAVTNGKPQAAEIEILPQEWNNTGFRILRESRRSRIASGGYPAWTLRAPPGETVRLTYVVEFED